MTARLMGATAAAVLILAPAGVHAPAWAALSERGGSGVFEVQSAESKRPGRLELGIFGSAQRLDLQDPGNNRFNALTGGVNAGIGLPGGFEISGAVPAYGYFLSAGGGALSLNDRIAVRLGDVAARMRWTSGFLMPGMRWGFEGEVTLPTGNDRIETYPGRTATRPFTLDQRAYTGRAMLTWDGLRAGTGAALRLHANGAYTMVQDESRFVLPHGPLPLELPAPVRNRDNDVLSLGAAVEVDLRRLTLFGEVVTDQFVNERGLLSSKENRRVVTPGVRFWIPGGLSLAAAYSMSLSEDDARTAFDPRREYPDHEWRVALSLGTIYRGARARAEDERALAAVTPAPAPATAVTPVAPAPGTAAAIEPAPPADPAQQKRETKQREILERRPSQQQTAIAPKTEPLAAEPVAPEAATRPAGAASAARPATPARLTDTDGDGIPDAQDLCPLVPEDWDGFQDLDGCPDLDNDGDGIPDTRDACPNDPETYNGYYDFDGCPDGPPVKWLGPSEGAPGSERDSVQAAAQDAARPAGSARTGWSPRAEMAPGRTPAAGDTAARRVAAPPAGPRAAAPAMMPSSRADSLQLVLDAERRRAGELAARLERSEEERRELVARMTAVGDTAREAAARGVVPPPAATRPMAPAAAPSPRADSLQLALEAERRRAVELASRLERSEGERRELLAHVMTPDTVTRTVPVPAAPARPATPPPAAPAPRDDAALAALEARLARLERTPPPTQPAPSPAGATVVNVPPPVEVRAPAPGADMTARVAELERELAALKSTEAMREAAPPPAAPPAAPPPAAPDTGRLLEERLEGIEARLDSLAALGAVPGSTAMLDALLPLGVSRAFREVRFETGSVFLTADATAFLTRLAEVLVAHREPVVRITGHTDDVGLAENNLRLSRERAASVAALLQAEGVEARRLIVEGRGEDEPFASNATAAGREANRRVTFTRIR